MERVDQGCTPEVIFSKKEFQIWDFESFIFCSKFHFLCDCFRAFLPAFFFCRQSTMVTGIFTQPYPPPPPPPPPPPQKSFLWPCEYSFYQINWNSSFLAINKDYKNILLYPPCFDMYFFIKKVVVLHHGDYNFLFWHLCQVHTFNNNLMKLSCCNVFVIKTSCLYEKKNSIR